MCVFLSSSPSQSFKLHSHNNEKELWATVCTKSFKSSLKVQITVGKEEEKGEKSVWCPLHSHSFCWFFFLIFCYVSISIKPKEQILLEKQFMYFHWNSIYTPLYFSVALTIKLTYINRKLVRFFLVFIWNLYKSLFHKERLLSIWGGFRFYTV